MFEYFKKLRLMQAVVSFFKKVKEFQKEEILWIPLSLIIVFGLSGLIYLGVNAII